MRLPVKVLVYPVRQNVKGEFEYLLLHRVTDRGGFWQGITGGVEKGETLLEAGGRELFEETGLIFSNIEEVDYSYIYPYVYKGRYQFPETVKEITEYVLIACIKNDGMVNLSHEHNEYRWCNYNEALSILKWPENRKALMKSHEHALQICSNQESGTGQHS